MKYPKQQRLVDHHEKNCHDEPKSEEPEFFPSKKNHSPKTCKQSSLFSFENVVALDSRSDETDSSMSSSL